MRRKLSIIAVLFAAGIVAAAGVFTSAARQAYKNRRIESEIDSLRAQAERIQNENSKLSRKIAYLQTPEFQEKVAKEKLNMQKPDEQVVIVKPGIENTPQVAGEQSGSRGIAEYDNSPNYKKWWDLFFKY